MYEYISSDDFHDKAIHHLSHAVEIPTESYDDFGEVGEDSRYEIMFKFQEYLKETFPLVHKHLNPEVVNTHGLVYTYKGSDDSLKPTLLMAHYDVVPVPNATVDAWTYPPYSGHYDGKYIWGRGSSDDKNNLIAIMETMELFLEAEWKPKRSIVLAFGFDEEVSGPQGAGHIAPFLLERYGKNGIAALVDEGSTFTKAWGSTFATVGTGEKGYTDVHITVRMPGGHSSIPSDHTSIGVLSELITKIEAEQYPTYLTDDNPYLGTLQCGAAHAPNFPSKLKHLLRRRSSSSAKPTCHDDPLALEAAKQGPSAKYLMQTSQAATVITGGVKVNALPERASATINHRINIGDSPSEIWSHLTSLARPLAEKYNLTLHAFNTSITEAPESLTLWSSPDSLPVAPVTPTLLASNDNKTTTPWHVFAATTRALYGKDIIVAPGMSTGNTDTRYYWALTRHIFRFSPGLDVSEGELGLGNIHTVDERVSVRGHVGMVRWFWGWCAGMDGVALEM